jgi:hypothetical protein
MNEPIGCALCGGSDHCADECKRFAGEREAFEAWFSAEVAEKVSYGNPDILRRQLWPAWKARAAQPAPVVPEGWSARLIKDGDAAGYVVSTPRDEAGVRSNTSVWADDDDPAHAMLWHMLDAAAPAQGHRAEFGDPYQGAREDLAIWKRRALEAEKALRQKDQIIDSLVLEAQGETRMGEPFIAQGQQVERWIPVSERLPEAFTVVALLDENRWMNTGCDDFEANWTGAGWLWANGINDNGMYWSAIGERHGLTMDSVTHWMSLPAAPTQGGDV